MRLVCKERPSPGCRDTRENLPMLPACTTFCACPGATCRVTLATVAIDADGPTDHYVRFGSKGSFGRCFHYFCVNLPPRWPSADSRHLSRLRGRDERSSLLGRIASNDEMRVGETPSTRTVRIAAAPHPNPPPASDRAIAY